MAQDTNSQRIHVSTPLSARKLQAVLHSPAPVTLAQLSCLGSTEGTIIRNAIKLIARKRSVKVLHPRLTLGIQSLNLLVAVIRSANECSSQRRVLNRLVSSLLGGNFSKPSLRTLTLVQTVTSLRANGMSFRRISKETNVSRSTVMRILKSQKVMPDAQ